MDDAPLEDLGRKQVDHGRHHLLCGNTQASLSTAALPLGPLRLQILAMRVLPQLAADGLHIRGVELGTVHAHRASPTASHPWPGEGLLVPQPGALDPLRREDSPGAQLGVDGRDVDPAAQPGLLADELAHHLGVLGLVFKVGLEHQALGDKGYQGIQRQVEPPRVHLHDDPGGKPHPRQQNVRHPPPGPRQVALT